MKVVDNFTGWLPVVKSSKYSVIYELFDQDVRKLSNTNSITGPIRGLMGISDGEIESLYKGVQNRYKEMAGNIRMSREKHIDDKGNSVWKVFVRKTISPAKVKISI